MHLGWGDELVDHRYFYQDSKRVGNYTCGIARETAARMLRYFRMNDFGNTNFLQALDHYINNPSVTGFFIEQAVLSCIANRGLDLSKELRKPITTVMFLGDYSIYNLRSDLTLYCPLSFNLRGIDGIILRLEPPVNPTKHKMQVEEPKQKYFIFPIQITIAQSHSDSESAFFNHWAEWTAGIDLGQFEIEVEFLWISNRLAAVKEIRVGSKRLKSGDKLTNPKYVSRNVPLNIISQDIWNSYQRALKSQRSRAFGQVWRWDRCQGASEQVYPSE